MSFFPGWVCSRVALHTVDIKLRLVHVDALPLSRLAAGRSDGDVLGSDVPASLVRGSVRAVAIYPARGPGGAGKLTSGLLQTRVPTLGSCFFDAVPQKFLNVMSEMVKFA